MFIFETIALMNELDADKRKYDVLTAGSRYELIRSKLAINDSQKILAEIQ